MPNKKDPRLIGKRIRISTTLEQNRYYSPILQLKQLGRVKSINDAILKALDIYLEQEGFIDE